jgi:hypothetical protein
MSGVADRDRGEWIPWYCDDSPGWLELSLAARGAAEGIARKMGRSRGELHLGSRGLKGLAVLLRCTWEELEPAMRELTTGEHPRFLLSADARVLIDPEHESRRRPTSAERVRRHRKSDRPLTADVTPVTVTSVTTDHVTHVTGASVSSPLLSSDLISSSADQKNLTGGSGAPPPDKAPEWFVDLVQAICDDTGEKFAVHEAWIRYSGHRATKGIAPSAQDARYWLGTVMVPEARKERRAESDRRLNQQRRDGPPAVQRETPEQAKEFARKLAERVAARKGAA